MTGDGPHPAPFPPGGATPGRERGLAAARRARLREIRSRILDAPLAWSVLFVGVVLLLLQSPAHWTRIEHEPTGAVAARDVVARIDFDVLDPELTEARRRDAESAVPDVYVLDTQRGARLSAEIRRLFEDGRRALATEDVRLLADVTRRAGPAGYAALAAQRFSSDLERTLIEAVETSQTALVVGNRALLAANPSILIVQSPSGREESRATSAGILDLDEAKRQVAERVARAVTGSAAECHAIATVATAFVDANLAFDPAGTTERRASAGQSVLPVRIHVPAGTVLVREGQKLTEETLALLDAARLASAPSTGAMPFLAVIVLGSLLAFFLQRYARVQQRGFRKIEGLHALLVQVMLGTLLLGQALLWVARGLADDLGAPFDRVASYPYLVPLGAGAILVALLANGRIAVVYATFTAALFGALTGWDGYHTIWALIVQLAGVYAVTNYRERAALLRAGLVVGGVGAVAAAAVEIMRRADAPGERAILAAVLSLIGGAIGVGLLLSFVLPLFERMFSVLTDVRLLELSNVNHPLLSELAQKAPGSYNHSLVVGTLAQEAAKSIGANPLFCRVAAFYHDIGKILKPEYYVENQHGENPHDHLTPNMSALVLSAHVKEGIRMARESGLPEQIIDIIPQHHGTRVMTYFLDKARRSADPTQRVVSEDEFRYPGPKPRTPEAAIFMLADAVEAAARTVTEPTPDRLRDCIRQVTDAIVFDHQLDECELTFADLERIQEAFLRALLGAHHHRPDYPGYNFGRTSRSYDRGGSSVARAAGGNG